MEKELQVTLDGQLIKQKNEWKQKVARELAYPYGLTVMGVTA